MKIDILKNILLKATRIGLATTLLTPLIFGPFGLNVVEYPQAVFFRSIIEIIFVLYFFLLLLDKQYLPKISPLLISILIFDAVLIISSIFGINFYQSFFGDLNRGEGIIIHLHLLVFFVVLTRTLKDREDWLDLLKISAFVSAVSSFTAILQQANILQLFNMYPPRISGTMSNPDIFAAYISLSIFIAVFLFSIEKNRNLRITWLVIAALNCDTLFFSSTRGSMLGAVLGFFLILSSMFLKLNYKWRVRILIAILILCIFILTIFVNIKLFEKLPGGYTISRFTEFNLNGRENIWMTFVPAFLARPISGWGFGSFTFISDKYMTSGLTLGAYYDRPHNKIIEVLLYSGIIGLIAYLSIFIIIFYLLFKHKISGGIILAAFFLCYFFQNIFLFDTTATYILFFLIAGFINNSFPGKTIATMVNPQHLQKNRGVLALKIISAGLIFLLIADVMYEINIKPTVAAMYFAVPVGLNTANKKIFSGYEKAISMNTIYDSDLMLEFTSKSFYLLGGGYANTFKQEVINALINMEPFLYKDIEIYHRQVNHSYQWLVAIDEQKYVSDKNTNDLNEMENTLKQAIAFNPNVPAYYGFDGELKILRGDYKGGEAEIKKDCDMNGCQPADLYKKIGSAYEDKGDKQEEMKNYQKALDIYLNNQGAVKPGTLVQFINYVGTKYCQELHDLKNCSRTFTQGANALPEYADILTQRFNQLTEIK